MILNKKWNVINTVLVVSTIIIILSYGIMKTWLLVGETVKNNKLSFDSIIDANNKRIDSSFQRWNLLTNSWWLSGYSDSMDLEEGKTIEISIPWNNINNSQLEVIYSTGTTTNFVWVELIKTKNNKLLINKSINTKWGVIIKDSSSWTETQMDSNILNQEYLLRNNNLDELSDFLSLEINKIWEPGSYLLFDFGFTTLLNNITFQLTKDSKTSFPNIIQLTFDNWIQHNFLVDDKNEFQKLYFPDIWSRYIRLDILSSSDWRVEIENSIIISNISRNITPSEIIINNDIINKKLDISYPAISTISWVKFINLYSWNNWEISTNSFKSLLLSDTSFEYFYSDLPLDTIYIEICSEIKACLPKVWKTIN